MRSDIESKIVTEKNIGSDGTVSTIFKSYVDKSTLGQWLLESYLAQRVRVDENFVMRENGKHLAFFNTGKDRDVGYLSDIYGYVGVLSLAMRMDVSLSDEVRNDIADNVTMILDYIDENGYTLFPYVREEDNVAADGKLFGRKSPYTGAVTWSLSFFTAARAAAKSGLIPLNKRHIDSLVSNIKRIIDYFNGAVIRNKNGEPWGWGYTEGCVSPSLFFTYSVLEAYSEFEDSVFNITMENDNVYWTPKDEELLAAINKGKQEGDKRAEVEWRENCFAVADKVWDTYKNVLKDDFVDDMFLRDYQVVTRQDIEKAERSNALFNNIYLVCILLYGYVNRRADDKDDVIITMEAALQNVQRVYHTLRQKGIEYLVDTYIIPFKAFHKDRKASYLKMNYKNLVDASLMPMLVKANNIIAYYISQYPVKQMSIFFEDLFDHMSYDGQWIWESKGYDVKINERYIEAIADFYAYYEKFERDYATKKNENDKAIRDLLTAERDRVRQQAEDDAQRAAEERFVRREKEIRAEYAIENEIRGAIERGVIDTVVSTLDSVSKKIVSNSPLTDTEARLFGSFEGFMKAYFTRAMSNVVADKSEMDVIMQNSKTDIQMFLAEWAEKLEVSKDSLTKLMKGDK